MIARLFALVLVFLTVPALAQTPDVVGTWELVAAENVPHDDNLVFARMTFTEDHLDAVFVFLDPDDAELSGRFERARVFASAGQLVVRDGSQVTVFDVVREETLMTIRDIETGVVLLMRAADPAGALDPDLIGRWSGTRDGQPFAVRFRADGRAEVQEGDDRDEGSYVVAGPYVLLGDDPARYTFSRDAAGERLLIVEADGEESILTPTP